MWFFPEKVDTTITLQHNGSLFFCVNVPRKHGDKRYLLNKYQNRDKMSQVETVFTGVDWNCYGYPQGVPLRLRLPSDKVRSKRNRAETDMPILRTSKKYSFVYLFLQTCRAYGAEDLWHISRVPRIIKARYADDTCPPYHLDTFCYAKHSMNGAKQNT